MSPLQFIRERIWSELPAEVTPRQRAWAALLWGIVLPAAVGLVRGLRHRGEPGAWTLLAWLLPAGALLALSLLLPATGRRAYLGVLRAASVLGFAISGVLLTLVFYLVVTPLGLTLRLAGKDLLERGFRGASPPRWRPHERGAGPSRYYRLF